MEYTTHTTISIKDNSILNEAWIQELIANNPSILGLGELNLISKEKILPGGGRLDLLLGDENTRYEVEIQLGKTDPSHIIRILEYWDLEKKRYPQYDHVAVLIAEDITSRFLNVISLFNGVIPIIALQMKAIEIDGKFTIVFTPILNLMALGEAEPDIADLTINSRYEWIARTSEDNLSLIDTLLETVNKLPGINGEAELRYRRNYISIYTNGFTIAYCSPKKKFVRVAMSLKRTTDMDNLLNNSDIDVMDYNVKLGRYRVKLYPNEAVDFAVIEKLLLESIQERSG